MVGSALEIDVHVLEALKRAELLLSPVGELVVGGAVASDLGVLLLDAGLGGGEQFLSEVELLDSAVELVVLSHVSHELVVHLLHDGGRRDAGEGGESEGLHL